MGSSGASPDGTITWIRAIDGVYAGSRHGDRGGSRRQYLDRQWSDLLRGLPVGWHDVEAFWREGGTAGAPRPPDHARQTGTVVVPVHQPFRGSPGRSSRMSPVRSCSARTASTTGGRQKDSSMGVSTVSLRIPVERYWFGTYTGIEQVSAMAAGRTGRHDNGLRHGAGLHPGDRFSGYRYFSASVFRPRVYRRSGQCALRDAGGRSCGDGDLGGQESISVAGSGPRRNPDLSAGTGAIGIISGRTAACATTASGLSCRWIQRSSSVPKAAVSPFSISTDLNRVPPRVVIDEPLVEDNDVSLSWKALAAWGDIPSDQIETRYRLSAGRWSPWSIDHAITFRDLTPGTYQFEVKRRVHRR